MSLVGAISVTIAAVFSLVALIQFFNPNARIRFAVIASYLMLVLVLITMFVTVVRWLQVLIKTGKLGKTRWPWFEENYRKLRIAIIALGTLCIVLAIISTVGTFIFAKKLNSVSYKVKNVFNKNDSEAIGDENWYEEACSSNPNGTECTLCEPCATRAACDACTKMPWVCSGCNCDPKYQNRFKCKGLGKFVQSFILKQMKNKNSTEEKQENALQTFLGDPAEDSPCKDYIFIKRKFCQIYEMTNSWQCNETKLMEDKLNCIAEVVEEGATKRYIVAGLLMVSILGHLVHLVVTIWCPGETAQPSNSERDYEYKLQQDENHKDKDKGGEQEELAGEDC